MCLFRKKNFKEANKANALVGAGIITIILSVLLPIIIRPCENLMPVFSSAQLAISAIGLILVIVALGYTMEQFQKSMAKPKIKVAFNEKGEQEANLTYINNNPCGLPPLWIINEGNEMSRFFQIDVIIPKYIVNHRGKTILFDIPHISLEEFGNEYILSYKNEGKYTLFINKPYNDTDFTLNSALDYKKCIELFKNDFILKYNIYGDWGEPQEGELKLIINKQEVS